MKQNVVIIPKLPPNVKSASSIESPYFKRVINFPDNCQYALVKSAKYEDDEFDFYEFLDDAIDVAMNDMSGLSVLIVDVEGSVFSSSGEYIYSI